MKQRNSYSPELRERAVRLVLEIHSTAFYRPSNFQPAVQSRADIGIVRASIALDIMD